VTGHLLASIAWNPEIRNILSLLVGVGVLCGSVYLVLATNLGARLGLMIALAGLLGWLTTMGVMWWIYGIGMKGQASHWQVVEINTGDLTASGVKVAQTLPEPSDLPDPLEVLDDHPELEDKVIPPGQEGKIPTLGELLEADPSLADELHLKDALGDWRLLLPSDPIRGDAVATSDAALAEEKKFSSTGDYKVLDGYSVGGKELLETDQECKPRFVHPEFGGCDDRVKHKLLSIWHWRHPAHYAVVQVQAVKHVTVAPGKAAPPPVEDPTKPVVSAIMIRNLGDLRFPAAVTTLSCGLAFAFTCWRLHDREKLVMAARAAAG